MPELNSPHENRIRKKLESEAVLFRVAEKRSRIASAIWIETGWVMPNM
jgi:hypothetical protein